MKSLFSILLFVNVIAFSCGNTQNDKCTITTQIEQLHQQKATATHDLDDLNRQLKAANMEYDVLKEKISMTYHIIKGGQPVYVLRLSVRQVSYSFSISKQIRDAINESTFEIPVAAEYYNRVQIGDNLFDEFRWGSLVMRSSFGKWRIKVEAKSISYV